jgi:hypothetical protein
MSPLGAIWKLAGTWVLSDNALQVQNHRWLQRSALMAQHGIRHHTIMHGLVADKPCQPSLPIFTVPIAAETDPLSAAHLLVLVVQMLLVAVCLSGKTRAVCRLSFSFLDEGRNPVPPPLDAGLLQAGLLLQTLKPFSVNSRLGPQHG